MLYTQRKMEGRNDDEALYASLEPVIRGMGMSLIELSVYRGKARQGLPATVQIKIVIYKPTVVGVDDCSKVHRTLIPRLELAYPELDIYLEVSSPGIDRLIKDGSEFVHYIGRSVKCYCTDISDWKEGVLSAATESKIVLRLGDEEAVLPYEIIAKARLNG